MESLDNHQLKLIDKIVLNRIIKNDNEYKLLLNYVTILFSSEGEQVDSEEFSFICFLIDTYEKKHYFTEDSDNIFSRLQKNKLASNSEYLGCGSNSCIIEKPSGPGTNGGCSCLKSLQTADRVRIEKFIFKIKNKNQELEDDNLIKFFNWRGIDNVNNVCEACQGSGKKTYANTTTWRGGIGGQALTSDVCDECWGSGDIENKGADLRELFRKLEKCSK